MIAICAILFAVVGLAAFAGCAIAPLLADETGPIPHRNVAAGVSPADPNRDRKGAMVERRDAESAAVVLCGLWTLDLVEGGLYL